MVGRGLQPPPKTVSPPTYPPAKKNHQFSPYQANCSFLKNVKLPHVAGVTGGALTP